MKTFFVIGRFECIIGEKELKKKILARHLVHTWVVCNLHINTYMNTYLSITHIIIFMNELYVQQNY